MLNTDAGYVNVVLLNTDVGYVRVVLKTPK